ncbi:DUF4377 domain-containing protein [Burkholderia stagnalis]
MLLLTLALAACTQVPEASNPVPPTAPASAAASATLTIGTGILSRYHWQLNDAFDSKGKRIDALFVNANKPVQLDFSANQLYVVNSCNLMSTSYSIKKGRLQVGQMAMTYRACLDAPHAALDGEIGKRLEGSPSVNLLTRGNTPYMQLATDSGDMLSFTGVPTAETRFGSRGETIFLEVAAQSIPCQHPLIPDKQCLLVRERHLDKDDLLADTPGGWQLLYQDIEGYTHTPGTRNVLRVKRYTINNPPVDGTSVAYLLDLMVGSEKVEQ